MTTSMIVPMILKRIAQGMQREMIDELPAGSDIRMDEVKVGRYQQPPNAAYKRLSVVHGDTEDPRYQDLIISRLASGNLHNNWQMEAQEIGGGSFWYRRGTVDIELFLISKGYTEEDARDIAYRILGRIQQKIGGIYVADLVDAYGEQASQVFSTASQMLQSGGPPASWIFRGKVFWDVLTERI